MIHRIREEKRSGGECLSSHEIGVRTTEVFDTFWRFAAERQEVYFSRLRRNPPPWTDDEVLAAFKFTNAYRAADRVSQYLIRHVIYQDAVPVQPEDVLFRILLFKCFNKIETWEMLEQQVGPITLRSFDVDVYNQLLTRTMASGQSIYSAAYIMPPATRLGHGRKHRNHLALLDLMMRDSLCMKLGRTTSMSEAYELLRSYPSIGSFLAYQYATDINYSELTDFPEDDFVAPGPGAIDGIHKAFEETGDFSDADIIRLTADHQEREFERRGLPFRDLFGRRLKLVDCQNLYCELGKYARVVHPEHTGRSGRTCIKQRFDATGPLPRPWFPPKWNLNERVSNAFGE